MKSLTHMYITLRMLKNSELPFIIDCLILFQLKALPFNVGDMSAPVNRARGPGLELIKTIEAS